MPDDVVLIRDCTYELNTGTVGVPVWVEVNGIHTFTPSPTTVRADTRTNEDGGRHRHLVASRGDAFTLAGKRVEDPATGVRDPGQEAVEAWAREIGVASIKQFRITSPPTAGAEVATFLASAEASPLGGGIDDASNWQVVVTVDGAITYT